MVVVALRNPSADPPPVSAPLLVNLGPERRGSGDEGITWTSGPWKRKSCMACMLKDSSTFVYGAMARWPAITANSKTSRVISRIAWVATGFVAGQFRRPRP